MFRYDDGLRITTPDLAVDVRRRQPRAFVSHAHFDHMGRHAFALCTPETSALYQFRMGCRETREMPWEEPIEWGGVRLTAYPAGHCLGSAMLHVEEAGRTLLYTGDFKLADSLTARRAVLPEAEILIIESTYGDPRYRFPARELVVEQLLETVAECLLRERTPVIRAYALGKAQEVTRILTDAGHRVWQAPGIHAVSQVYEQCGMPLGDIRPLSDGAIRRGETAGDCVLVTPGKQTEVSVSLLPRPFRISTTGWAMSGRGQWNTDLAIPLSDHADYDELLEAVARVNPREVYCTHGPPRFADRLRDAGHNAYVLSAQVQRQLF